MELRPTAAVGVIMFKHVRKNKPSIGGISDYLILTENIRDKVCEQPNKVSSISAILGGLTK